MDINLTNDFKLNKICRACLLEKAGLKPLFDACVADMFMFCTSLVVSIGYVFVNIVYNSYF